jgi:hypothetical protein
MTLTDTVPFCLQQFFVLVKDGNPGAAAAPKKSGGQNRLGCYFTDYLTDLFKDK